jgi:hypothetical protein
MRRNLRRRVRALQAYAGGTSLALVVVVCAGMAQSNGNARFDELTVQRLNVVDANGTLRVVVSNKDRQHPGVLDGTTINRPRPDAGLIFFNDVGDEVGGLVFAGREINRQGNANAGLTFDQWKQDQIVGIQYVEERGQRSAGLRVWDRSDTQRLSELIDKVNSANAIVDATARSAAVKAAQAGAQPGHERLFVGKDRNKASIITLADANGKPRLVLKVQADGAAGIEFLDADGKVTRRLPN